ncbi:C45 family peptidase [Vibrio sp. JC009]|uniref:C45 family autoproteolytic acyltransferase/hydolase n=1 Tax=Vibrio sp. JC009 TaxID=2912314 RepID=UPI0023B17361|nr:C45 family peptidase [Vibrio sp. JC009]WED23120.1 C45 family peptidase [Vibrio sp. JC009]
MRVIEFSGSHYQLGYLIGERSKSIFATYIMQSEGFKTLSQWKNTTWFQEVKQLIATRQADIHSELQGIADGAEQSYDDILLWNCRGDLIHCVPEGCTSIGVTQDKLTLVAHNEDGDPELKPYIFLLKAELDASASFTSFVYPASVPGHSFAMNEHGLAFSVNNIRLTDYQAGLPRMVTARSLLMCRDYQEFIQKLESQTRTGAFHYTVADLTNRKAFSIEAPFQKVSAIEAAPVRVHANHLVHDKLNHVNQIITDSSASRQSRMEELTSACSDRLVTSEECLKILRDKHDEILPVFRTAPDDPDEENTLATAIFSFKKEGLLMEVFAPDSNEPVYTELNKAQQ